MATELSREELQRLARLGAQRRLEELRQEEAAIRAAFPDIDDSGRPRRGRGGRRRASAAAAAPAAPAAAAGAGTSAGASSAAGSARKARKAKRNYKMSAAQKRAVSERMKKYWAARRKAKS